MSNLYDSDDNGSGYEDEIIPGVKKPYHSLNNIIDNNDIADAYKDATDTDDNGYGDKETEEYDDVWDE